MADAVDARLVEIARALDIAAYPLSLEDVLGRLVRAMDVDAAVVRLVHGDELVLHAARGVEAHAAPLRIRIGETTAGVAAARRAPLVLPDVAEAGIPDPWLSFGVSSVVVLPLLDGPRLVGVLKLGTRTPRDFTADVPLLELACAWLAVAVERSREREERRLQQARERLLADFSAAINASVEDLEQSLQLTAERVAEQIGDMCGIWLLDEDGEWLTNAAMHASEPALRDAAASVTGERRHVDSERIATSVVREGRTLFLPEVVPDSTRGFVADKHHEVSRSIAVTSLISCPLRARGKVIGTVNIARSPGSASYTHADRAFLEELATRAGIAIDNARLFRAAQETAGALALSEQRVRAMFDSASVGIVARDPDGLLVECNAAYARMLGYRREELLGTHVSKVVTEGSESLFEALDETSEMVESEQVYRRPSGETLHARVTYSPVRTPEGTLLYWFGLVEDVTEAQQLGEQLRQAQKMEAIGQLAGGVAHDFNNLLTVIRGYGQLAQQRIGDGPGAQELSEILHSAERAAQLVRQLLAFSHRQRLTTELLDLNVVAGDVMPMLRRLILEDVDIAFTPQEPLPAVMADRGQLEQVILNLAVNARDADGGRRGGRGRGRRARPVRLPRALRYRRRHVGGDAGTDLRALLHHEARRPRYGPRPRDRLRDREAVRRPRPRRQPTRRRLELRGLPARLGRRSGGGQAHGRRGGRQRRGDRDRAPVRGRGGGTAHDGADPHAPRLQGAGRRAAVGGAGAGRVASRRDRRDRVRRDHARDAGPRARGAHPRAPAGHQRDPDVGLHRGRDRRAHRAPARQRVPAEALRRRGTSEDDPRSARRVVGQSQPRPSAGTKLKIASARVVLPR